MKSEERGAYIGLVLMTLIIGLSFIFVKIALGYSNPYDLLAHRFSAAFIAIATLNLLGVVKIPKIKKGDRLAVVGVALLYPVGCFGFQAVGMQFTTAAEAGIIFAFLPAIMLIIERFLFGERSSSLQKLGIFLSIGGLLFIFLNRGVASSQNIKGVVLLFLSVLSMAGYFIVGKGVIRSYRSAELTAIMIVVGFLFFNTISLFRHIGGGTITQFLLPLKSAPFLLSVLYLGILSSVVTSFFSNYALNYIPASKIAIFSNLNPIIAIAGAVLLLGEKLFWFEAVGAVTVVAGLILVILFKGNRE
ncbi:MAG: DMT family transporter [Bacteroidales bacterium]